MQPVLAFVIGPWELGLVLLIVLILFGAGRLPQVLGAIGDGVRKLKDSQAE